MGRRGALLIQTIAAGIERLDMTDPTLSFDRTTNSVDSIRSRNREIDPFGEVREGQASCDSLMSLPSKRMSRCH
jgi:hypothetical protein